MGHSPVLEEEMALEKGASIFPANGAFICPVSPWEYPYYPTIKILTEALRIDPRRAEKVIERNSLLELKMVSYLFDLHLFELRLWGQSLLRSRWI